MTEIESIINNGLPIRVRATVNKCGPHEWPGADFLEDMELLWMNGGPCNLNLTQEDAQRLADELFEAARQPPCDL